jgi:hypothetical protein
LIISNFYKNLFFIPMRCVKVVCIFLFLLITMQSRAQVPGVFNADTAEFMLKKLSDNKYGRGNYTPGLDTAAEFIQRRFQQYGLQPWPGRTEYALPFEPWYDPKGKDSTKNFKWLHNVVGYLRGDSLPDEFIYFTAHYDHIGNSKNLYPGANDNASGTTAMLLLAKYWGEQKGNRRSIVFCAFAGEELGMLGSEEFLKWNDRKKIKAVINLEMLGIPSVGRNRFFITGAERSTLEKIMKPALSGTGVRLIKDTEPGQNLFERSDNFPFFRHRVVAHTIMAGGEYKCYHQPCDEVHMLDIPNLVRLTAAIAQATGTLVSGAATPSLR